MTRYGFSVLALYTIAVAGAAIAAGLLSAAPAVEEPAEPKAKAARVLATNWLIQPGDIAGKAPKGVVGAYASKPIAAGGLVASSALPALPANVLLVALPVARKLVTDGQVNAGRRIRVCSGTTMLPVQPKVEAVLCPAGAVSSCAALVRAEPAMLASNDLLLRGAAATCTQQGAQNPDSTPTKE